MRKNILTFFFLFCLLNISAQEPQTYALIIGISEYAEIASLDYAHRDAQAFADFLQTPNGGKVPIENITLLLNKDASFMAIGLALRELTNKVEKNDRVYIFFSGHGDLENEVIQKGFLLASNTPQKPYIMNAVSINELNDVVSLLSTRKDREAQVILITDACHSGKGIEQQAFKGAQLAAEQLRVAKNNEVRISSCTSNELSYEDERWGGGRGIFSYYLIKGMKGGASPNPDGFITLDGVKTYLQEGFKKDPVLKLKPKNQTPVFNGTPNFKLNKLAENKKDSLEGFAEPEALPKTLSSYYFDALPFFNMEQIFDYDLLKKMTGTEIPDYCIRVLSDTIKSRKERGLDRIVRSQSAYYYGDYDTAKINELKRVLKENSYVARQFKNKLAQELSDKGQFVLNAYLKGDTAELNKREIYFRENNSYAAYPKMFAVAAKLIYEPGKKQSEPERQMEFKEYYFNGIVERLNGYTANNYKEVLEKAIGWQLKALAIEEDAAYIYNELGVLYLDKKNYDSAAFYFTTASEKSPDWALPFANLAGLYTLKKETEKGIEYGEKAIALQPELNNGYTNLALLYQQKNNWLTAEELLLQSLQLNNRELVALKALGMLNLHKGNYSKADSLLFLTPENLGIFQQEVMRANRMPPGKIEPMNCALKEADVQKGDYFSNLVLGVQYLAANEFTGDFPNAEKCFQQALQYDPENHLAYHLLGKVQQSLNKWQEAEKSYKLAEKFYINDSLYNEKIKAYLKKGTDSNRAACFVYKIPEYYYPVTGNYFCLGQNYFEWGFYEKAAEQFKKAIEMEPDALSGYYKLCNLYIDQRKYTEAEHTILTYNIRKNWEDDLGVIYLTNFYKKILEVFPNNLYWNIRAGSFFYDEIILRKRYERELFDQGIITTGNKFITSAKLYYPIDLVLNEFIGSRSPEVFKNDLYSKTVGLEVPGIREKFDLEFDRYAPVEEYCLNALKKAESLLQDNEDAISDLNEKIGDIYNWYDTKNGMATAYYKKALQFSPYAKNDNSNRVSLGPTSPNKNNIWLPLKLINYFAAKHLYRDALETLDTLSAKNMLPQPYLPLYADYLNRAGRWKASDQQLQQMNTGTVQDTALTELKSKIALIRKEDKRGIEIFNNALKVKPADSSLLYGLAELFAKQNNPKKALFYLEKAIQHGFRFGYVLKFDPVWEKLKNDRIFKEIILKCNPLIYEPFAWN